MFRGARRFLQVLYFLTPTSRGCDFLIRESLQEYMFLNSCNDAFCRLEHMKYQNKYEFHELYWPKEDRPDEWDKALWKLDELTSTENSLCSWRSRPGKGRRPAARTRHPEREKEITGKWLTRVFPKIGVPPNHPF